MPNSDTLCVEVINHNSTTGSMLLGYWIENTDEIYVAQASSFPSSSSSSVSSRTAHAAPASPKALLNATFDADSARIAEEPSPAPSALAHAVQPPTSIAASTAAVHAAMQFQR